MKREELIAMGISEENVEKIMADHGSAVQEANAKAEQYRQKAETADDLQKKLDDLEAGNLSDLEMANKNLESAQKKIAELEKNNAIRDQREKVMEKMKVTSEQAKQIVKDDGNIDYDVLGQITSDKESAAAEAKEKEIADNSTNPGGGKTGDSGEEKTTAEKMVEKLYGGQKQNNDILSHYVGGN